MDWGLSEVLDRSNQSKKESALRLGSIIQQLRVKMDAEGVSAAAVTMKIQARAAPLKETPVFIEVHLNRPYAYAVCNAQGVVVFSGLMNGIDDEADQK